MSYAPGVDEQSPTLRIIGVPLDLGQSRRGVDMGPSALRYAGLARRLRGLGYRVENAGNVEVSERDTLPPEGGLAYLPEVVRACKAAYRQAHDAVADGKLPIFLGGDHSIAVGTVGGVTHERACGLLWIDAHADLNTPETSPTGNLHGMPLAALLGHGARELVDLGRPGPKVSARDVVLIGIRDLDQEERELLRDSGVTVYTMREVDERGIADIANEALQKLAHLPSLHVSLDLDSVDPRAAPGVGTPVPGGLSYREAHLLMEVLADSSRIGSVDLVEVNPILDERNVTAQLALELLASLLGKKIL